MHWKVHHWSLWLFVRLFVSTHCSQSTPSSSGSRGVRRMLMKLISTSCWWISSVRGLSWRFTSLRELMAFSQLTLTSGTHTESRHQLDQFNQLTLTSETHKCVQTSARTFQPTHADLQNMQRVQKSANTIQPIQVELRNMWWVQKSVSTIQATHTDLWNPKWVQKSARTTWKEHTLESINTPQYRTQFGLQCNDAGHWQKFLAQCETQCLHVPVLFLFLFFSTYYNFNSIWHDYD